jgi:hypothetical protein
MACADTTPYSISDYPFTINRLRTTDGDSTNQSTGEWTAPIESSFAVMGYLGIGKLKLSMNFEKMQILSGGQFEVGDLYFMCHSDCDVVLNDLLEVYEDAAGTDKTYWRVISKNTEKNTLNKLVPFGRFIFLVRKEPRK